MTSIVAAGSVASFFDEVVEDALKATQVEASQSAARYLVGVLSDFTRPDSATREAFDRPLTLVLQEALVTPAPAERFERLRHLGDAVLYASGFFADHFVARGVEPSYVFGIGSRAYGTAGAMLRAGSPSTTNVEDQARGNAPPERRDVIDVFSELSDHFDQFASVLAEVSDIAFAKNTAGARGLLRMYEKWLKTGSERLAGELTAHGLIPTRPVKGLQ